MSVDHLAASNGWPPRKKDVSLLRLGVCFLATVTFAAACAAPFAEMQSARLAGRGKVEVTPFYSHMDIADDGETAKLQDVFGMHLATGITERLDLRARLERVVVNDAEGVDFSVTVLGLGPKLSLIPDQLALHLPVGFAFGSDIDESQTWQFHPSVIGTIPVVQTAEFNGSFKLLIPISDAGENNDVLLALNLGLGIGPDRSRWAIRPEVGFLRNPGESGTIRHFSIGFTLFLGAER